MDEVSDELEIFIRVKVSVVLFLEGIHIQSDVFRGVDAVEANKVVVHDDALIRVDEFVVLGVKDEPTGTTVPA